MHSWVPLSSTSTGRTIFQIVKSAVFITFFDVVISMCIILLFVSEIILFFDILLNFDLDAIFYISWT